MSLKPLDIPAGFHGNGTDLEESDKWIDGSLVRWLDGSLRPIGGWRHRIDRITEKTVRAMHAWQANDNTAWLAAGAFNELTVVNAGGTKYNITPDSFVEGREDGAAGTGYGNGLYGVGVYGVPISPTSDSVPLPATTWDMDNFGEILIACSVSDGKLWEWDPSWTNGSELVTNGTFDADSDWTKGNGGAGGTNWIIASNYAKYEHYKPTFDASDTAVVDVSNDTITITGHRFSDGDEVVYNIDGGTAITGLTDGTTYYIVSSTANTFKLSATSGGTAIDLTVVGAGTQNLDRQNFGNLEQTVSGLQNASNDDDTHELSVRFIDLVDVDGDPTTAPDANIKVTGTTSTTVLVDQKLVAGDQSFRFGTDDTEVKIEIVPNAYNTSDFYVDTVSLKNVTVAVPLSNAPEDNLGAFVTEERFIFALGAGGNPKRIQWCDREARTTWTAAATNEAGDIDLATSGQIMCAAKARGSTVVITDFDCHQATYIGPPYVYSFQRVGTNCGAVSRKSAVSTDRGVFWYGQENFFMFDGNTVSVVPCDVHDYVFDDFNTSQQSKVWGFVNGTHQEVWWFYPSGGSTECDRYVAYDFMEGHWLVGELGRTAGVSRGVFAYPLMAGKDDPETQNYTVTVVNDGGNKFNFAELSGNAPELELIKGKTYVFDVSDSSNSEHPLAFKTSDHVQYTTGITSSGTAGTAGATITFVVPETAPDFLRYYCTVHGNGMGNIIDLHNDTIIYDHEIGHNYDSSLVFAETGPISIGVGDQVAKVNSVIPDEKTQGDVNLIFKTRFHPNETEVSHGPFDPSNPLSLRFTGRQLRMRVEQDRAVDWRVGIMRLETVPGGRR